MVVPWLEKSKGPLLARPFLLGVGTRVCGQKPLPARKRHHRGARRRWRPPAAPRADGQGLTRRLMAGAAMEIRLLPEAQVDSPIVGIVVDMYQALSNEWLRCLAEPTAGIRGSVGGQGSEPVARARLGSSRLVSLLSRALCRWPLAPAFRSLSLAARLSPRAPSPHGSPFPRGRRGRSQPGVMHNCAVHHHRHHSRHVLCIDDGQVCQ